MNTSSPDAPVCCFGEMLWDVLPDGPQPGGAPLNVTYHLAKLGIKSFLVSRIGADSEGSQLKQLMEKWSLSSVLVQTDSTQETSRVLAKLNSNNEVTYDIIFPVAWDFIRQNKSMKDILGRASYLIYGSLAARHSVSRKTLFSLLDYTSGTKVLDVNLRPPFYQKETLEHLLSKADILKMNQAELEVIDSLFGNRSDEEEKKIKAMRNRFEISEIIVTKGAEGASYYTPGGSYHLPGKTVEVCDTIGSGDAFLSAFIAAHFRSETPEIRLKKAAAMGAFVAGKKGGCPSYRLAEYLNFYEQI